MIAELVRQNRSCRRFYQNHAVDLDTLKYLADLGRLSASGANLQPLKYILSCNSERNQQIFSCLAWAGYLKDWPGPEEGEKPAAYIVVLRDSAISQDAGCDHGIAAQSILLAAREKGIAGCMLGSINRDKLTEKLKIPSHLKILIVIALGKPKEEVVIDNVKESGSIKYWRDDKDVHHVPKRTLEEVVIAMYSSS